MKIAEFERFLSSQGWTKGNGKRHAMWIAPDGRHFPLGRHRTQEMSRDFLNMILREYGLKEAYKKYRLGR